MGKNSNVIQINGKRYDADTGALLKSVDGFTVKKSTALQPVERVAPIAITKKPVMSEVVRKPVNHAAKHPMQGSKTLMRHAVTKPSVKKPLKAQTALAARPAASVTPKTSAHSLDPHRTQLAKQVPKSALVHKFTPTKPHHNTALLTPKAAPKPLAAKPAPKKRTTADMLQAALENATSHEQTYKPPASKFRTSRRIGSTVAVSVAALAILTIAGLHGVTAVKLHVASSKAGFAVAVPTYKPAGFSLKNVSYNTGNAGLHFASNSDNKQTFSVTEQASQWDSSTLRDMVVAPGGSTYQTVESAGRTIYLDDQHSTANWVNGGIWYQVKNQNALSDHELVQIANSL